MEDLGPTRRRREEKPLRNGSSDSDASIFIAEILLPFSPNPELYPLLGFDR
jgi:hypothetical protein